MFKFTKPIDDSLCLAKEDLEPFKHYLEEIAQQGEEVFLTFSLNLLEQAYKEIVEKGEKEQRFCFVNRNLANPLSIESLIFEKMIALNLFNNPKSFQLTNFKYFYKLNYIKKRKPHSSSEITAWQSRYFEKMRQRMANDLSFEEHVKNFHQIVSGNMPLEKVKQLKIFDWLWKKREWCLLEQKELQEKHISLIFFQDFGNKADLEYIERQKCQRLLQWHLESFYKLIFSQEAFCEIFFNENKIKAFESFLFNYWSPLLETFALEFEQADFIDNIFLHQAICSKLEPYIKEEKRALVSNFIHPLVKEVSVAPYIKEEKRELVSNFIHPLVKEVSGKQIKAVNQLNKVYLRVFLKLFAELFDFESQKEFDDILISHSKYASKAITKAHLTSNAALSDGDRQLLIGEKESIFIPIMILCLLTTPEEFNRLSDKEKRMIETFGIFEHLDQCGKPLERVNVKLSYQALAVFLKNIYWQSSCKNLYQFNVKNSLKKNEVLFGKEYIYSAIKESIKRSEHDEFIENLVLEKDVKHLSRQEIVLRNLVLGKKRMKFFKEFCDEYILPNVIAINNSERALIFYTVSITNKEELIFHPKTIEEISYRYLLHKTVDCLGIESEPLESLLINGGSFSNFIVESVAGLLAGVGIHKAIFKNNKTDLSKIVVKNHLTPFNRIFYQTFLPPKIENQFVLNNLRQSNEWKDFSIYLPKRQIEFERFLDKVNLKEYKKWEILERNELVWEVYEKTLAFFLFPIFDFDYKKMEDNKKLLIELVDNISFQNQPFQDIIALLAKENIFGTFSYFSKNWSKYEKYFDYVSTYAQRLLEKFVRDTQKSPEYYLEKLIYLPNFEDDQETLSLFKKSEEEIAVLGKAKSFISLMTFAYLFNLNKKNDFLLNKSASNIGNCLIILLLSPIRFHAFPYLLRAIEDNNNLDKNSPIEHLTNSEALALFIQKKLHFYSGNFEIKSLLLNEIEKCLQKKM